MKSRMLPHFPKVAPIVAVILLVLPTVAGPAKHPAAAANAVAASVPVRLWNNPTDIASRDLFFGPGGKDHAPQTSFEFVKEDAQGTNPKFDLRDKDGVKWKAKLGVEARPEVVASRLVWAVGYYASEDYFLPEIQVKDMPRLKRGQEFVSPDGVAHNVRLKRESPDAKKAGTWKWSDNPFANQRELNGLRVMMALMNNWDLKDTNNAVFEDKESGDDSRESRYLVSDLGASFGTTGISWTHERSKGNLKSYRNSKFITKATSEHVDFSVPSAPPLLFVLTPKDYFSRVKLRWIGKGIPRSDAKWIGSLLAQLSPEQIRSAFRAADYSPAEVEEFSEVVEKRIAELNRL